MKNICERLLLKFLSHSSTFIIYVIYWSTKNKIQRWGFIFLQKSKIKTLRNRKRFFFPVNSFPKILIFHICVYSENAQCFVRAFLYVCLKTWKSKSRVTSLNPRVAGSNPRVTSSNLQITSSNSRVRTLKALVATLKARVGNTKSTSWVGD